MAEKRSPINIEVAVRMYYEKISLTNADIKTLFGVTSNRTIAKYKNEVVNYFAKTDVDPVHYNRTLDTWRAFEAWGIDIAELEKRLSKIRRLDKLCLQ